MKIKTKDLYCAAYIVSRGGTVEDIVLTEDGRRGRPSSAVFVLSGANVEALSKEFLSGQAEANLAAFKQAMNQLKERMFDLIDARKEPNAPSARERTKHV
jgi:hypothetical protein